MFARCNSSKVVMVAGDNCVPNVSFGCRQTGEQSDVWANDRCNGWFVLDGLYRYLCASRHCWTYRMLIAEGGSILTPRNRMARHVSQLQAQPVIDAELMARIQADPAFERIPLVHVDTNTRRPEYFNDESRGANPSVENSTHVPRLRSLRHFVYNPSVLDADNLFVKVSSFAHCALGQPTFTLDNRRRGAHFVVWLERRAVRAVIGDAEDPFALRLGGRRHVLFARKHGRSSAMVLAALEPTYREIALNFSRMGLWEKNWAPFEHDDALHVAYRLCPLSVLRCDADNGRCDDLPHPMVSHAQPANCIPSLSGSGQMIAFNSSHFIGIAHSRSQIGSSQRWAWNISIDRVYEHRLYAMATRPAFKLVLLSEPFHFPRYFQTQLDLVQFCGGLAMDTDAPHWGARRNVTISYGVGDCVGMRLSARVDHLLALTSAAGR